MRLRVTAVVAAVGLLGSTGCARARVATVSSGPALIAAITWNTHSGRGDIAHLAADLDRGAFTSPAAPASLFLLQEVTAAEVETLARPRGWATVFVQVRSDGSRRGNAIVSSLPLANPRVVPLPRVRQSRAAVVARVTIAGQELFVASVHLENRVSWWQGGLFSDHGRRLQAEGLLRALPVVGPGIVGGDLNTWLGPNEAAWRALAGRFTDTSDWPGAPTFANRLVLDHVLMDLPEGWRVTRRVLPDDYGSDHHPVLALVYTGS
jgi:endonuclease/exonuclease/phosphatase family metal-dependent hydrolase